MIAVHDVGGLLHFGLIEMDGGHNPPFHTQWHERVFAMFISVFVAGYFTFDEARHEIEKLDRDFYENADYYARWLRILEIILVRHQVITGAEIDQRVEQLKRDSSCRS
jgi:nitrile hydratase